MIDGSHASILSCTCNTWNSNIIYLEEIAHIGELSCQGYILRFFYLEKFPRI